jgi:hypothetical protein
MQKIYDMFDTLSLSDQVKITNDFKNIIDNKRRDIFMKNICKDLVFELNTYNNQNYIILIFPGKKYQIFLFVQDFNFEQESIKVGINMIGESYDKSYFESIPKTVIGKDSYITYYCRECSENGDYDVDSDIDVYFQDDTIPCLQCKSKFLSCTTDIPHEHISMIFNEYHMEYIRNFNIFLFNIYTFFDDIHNIRKTTTEDFCKKNDF